MGSILHSRELRLLARPFARRVLVVIALALSSCGGSGGPAAPGGGGSVGVPPAPFFFAFPATGHSVTLAFPNPGVFGYHCNKHGSMGMTGGVTVDTTGLDSVVVGVGSGGNVYNPASVAIKPGGTVRWVNVSTRTDHTVTSD